MYFEVIGSELVRSDRCPATRCHPDGGQQIGRRRILIGSSCQPVQVEAPCAPLLSPGGQHSSYWAPSRRLPTLKAPPGLRIPGPLTNSRAASSTPLPAN